ncbi:hypothetical protein P280DRAFT_546501 [Massarina eburnea CBS 473.64]|uniref:Uncharacterized protein n=1 Tax=Massarina eburnea CBS 473.64 TaxID=1395130 RepID=A0A6A6SBF4_9PLEO|nr:hypothetical protein P280DRAFT_546501 [Massarina eburnea CBS 473.64]
MLFSSAFNHASYDSAQLTGGSIAIAMSFKRLAIRTKKSISGLYSSSNGQSAHTPEAVDSGMGFNPDHDMDSVDKFGMSSSSSSSPSKDSPSKRKRLLGTLRSMGSLRSLRSSQANAKVDSSPPKAESPRGTPCRAMPTLALDFEVSPPGKPMFDTSTRKASDSSSMNVLHSSPMAMPMPTTPPATDSYSPPGFVVGSVPDTPAPIQRPSVQKAILAASSLSIEPTSTESSPARVQADPNPTPMPGTNLPLDRIDPPQIVVQSPSAPSINQKGLDDYFSLFSSKEKSHKPDSVVVSDPLPVEDDLEFDEMIVKATTTVPATPPQSPRSSCDGVGETLPYIVWDNPVPSEEGEAQQECQTSTSNYTGQWDLGILNWQPPDLTIGHNGSGSASSHPRMGTKSSGNTEAETASTWTDIDSETQSMEPHSTKAVLQEPRSSIDDGEALQKIIRAYAGPMIYGDEEHDLADDQTEEICRQVRSEVDLSFRVMNESLGG